MTDERGDAAASGLIGMLSVSEVLTLVVYVVLLGAWFRLLTPGLWPWLRQRRQNRRSDTNVPPANAADADQESP